MLGAEPAISRSVKADGWKCTLEFGQTRGPFTGSPDEIKKIKEESQRLSVIATLEIMAAFANYGI